MLLTRSLSGIGSLEARINNLRAIPGCKLLILGCRPLIPDRLLARNIVKENTPTLAATAVSTPDRSCQINRSMQHPSLMFLENLIALNFIV